MSLHIKSSFQVGYTEVCAGVYCEKTATKFQDGTPCLESKNLNIVDGMEACDQILVICLHNKNTLIFIDKTCLPKVLV